MLNDLRYYRHQLHGRASEGEVPQGSLRRLDQLLERLSALGKYSAADIAAQKHEIHLGVRQALSLVPVDILQEQQLKWETKSAAMNGASLASGIASDFLIAIKRSTNGENKLEQLGLTAADATPGSAARQEALRKIATLLHLLPAAQRSATLTSLQKILPELPAFFAAYRIASAGKSHSRMKREAIARARNENKQFGSLQYNNQVYYYPVADRVRQRFPVAYAPQTRPEKEAKGSYKQLVGLDRNFVALTPRSEGFDPARDIADILPFETVSAGLVVDANLMLARNAGKTLQSRLDLRDSLPLSVFKSALTDLDAMHDADIFLVDIKPENLAYDGKKVNFIDVDDRVNWHPNQPSMYSCSEAWTTYGLIDGMYYNRRAAFQVADQFAMLRNIIALARPGNTKSYAIQTRWVNQHIKHQYRDHVKRLLSDPGDIANKAEGAKTRLPKLTEMLKL